MSFADINSGERKELHIDLSDFDNPSTHDFQSFIAYLEAFTELKAQEPDNPQVPHIAFEETLSCVLLPNFALSTECPFEHKILPFLDLIQKRGVRKIINLIVPDSISKPTSEGDIATLLEKFEIERLNWQKLDMDLEILREKDEFMQLRELYLYSSGNWGLLYFWGKDDILHNMKKVRQ